ncbi:MAG TPA: peptidylprolyl isomerase [Luteibaculaceae bacterium]|nr:peptidylprolyl isomerase [Luteibaculaceae bacterium]
MVSINKIRENSGLVLILVGIAMVAFILGDLFTQSPGQQAINIGEVAGENIEIADFEARLAKEREAIESTGQRVDDATLEQLRNQVWNQFIRDVAISTEFDEIGIDVSEAEYDDVRFGANVLDEFKNNQGFVDPKTGQFSPEMVKMSFNQLMTNYPEYWKSQRDRIIETRKQTKYSNLVKKGIFVNKIEAEEEYVASNRKINFNFVAAKFASIADSLVKPTEDELKTYFNKVKNLKKYEQAESRSIEYVSFEIRATDEDIKAAREGINALIEPFKTSTNDSAFVINNSDQKFYQPEVYQKGSTDPATDSAITRGSVGTVVGPYPVGDQLRLAKVVANGKQAEVFPRHILLKPSANATNEQLKAKADSLMAEIKKNNNFADVARIVSEDPGSAQNGGDLEWVGQGSRMVKTFEEACLKLNKGEMGICETEFGVHLIEAKDRREVDQIKLAIVSRSMAPGKTTINEIYEKASSFSINNNTVEKFNAAVEKEKLIKQSAPALVPQSRYIPGISDPTQVMRWVNNAEEGQVSEPIEVGNQFIVAALTRITEEGTPAFEDIKDIVEREVIKEKKAQMLIAKIKGKDLATIAAGFGETVQPATAVSFSNAVIPGAGREPKLLGVVVTLPANAVSKPIIGENGVYIVQVQNITEPMKTKDLKLSKDAVAAKYGSRTEFGALNALIEMAKVKDFRYKFY